MPTLVWAHNAMARGRRVSPLIPRVSPWAIVGIAPSGAQAILCTMQSLTAIESSMTGSFDPAKRHSSSRSQQDASTRPMSHVTDDSQKSHPWHLFVRFAVRLMRRFFSFNAPANTANAGTERLVSYNEGFTLGSIWDRPIRGSRHRGCKAPEPHARLSFVKPQPTLMKHQTHVHAWPQSKPTHTRKRSCTY